MSLVLPENGFMHVMQHYFPGFNSSQSDALLVIWAAVIWTQRNGLIFREEVVDVGKVIDLVQYFSWLWLIGKCRDLSYSFFEWVSNPIPCLK